jgi:hypothetical protein
LQGLDSEDPDDTRHLRAFAFGLEAVLPAGIDPADSLAEAFEALHELVGRREPTLSVLLSLARSLLVARIDGTPLARARDVHPFFHAELTAAASSHATAARWLLAVPGVLNAHPCASGLARVDVVATIGTADGLEQSWAKTGREPGNAPAGTGIADEAVQLRVARHGLVTPAAMLDLVVSLRCLLHGVSLSVGATDEAFQGARIRCVRIATTRKRRHDCDRQ